MAEHIERLTYVFGLKNNAAVERGFKTLAKGAGEAEGGAKSLTQKLGNFASSAGPYVAAATGVGLALFKMAGSFEDLALKSRDFSNATGTGVEAASRWIEVTHDLGIDSGSLETALGKMNKTLGKSPQVFAAAGVEVAHLKDGTVDVSGTFLNLVDVLNNTKDEAQKSRIAAQLLGKGWQSTSTLIAEGSDKIKASMAGVSSGQVITPEEVKKAEAYHKAMDQLGDSLKSLVIDIGQSAAPALATLAKGIVEVIKLAGYAKQVVTLGGGDGDARLVKRYRAEEAAAKAHKKIMAGLLVVSSPDAGDRLVNLSKGWTALGEVQLKTADASDKLAKIQAKNDGVFADGVPIHKAYRMAVDDDTSASNRYFPAADQVTKAMQDQRVAAKALADKELADLENALKATALAWDSLTGKLDDEQAWLQAQDTVDALKKKIEDFNKKKPKLSSAEVAAGLRSIREDILSFENGTLDPMIKKLNLPPSIATKLNILADTGQLDKVLAKLALIRSALFQIDPKIKMVPRGQQQPDGGAAGAEGAIVTRPTMALIGEAGPEALIPLNRMPGASPLPAGADRGGGRLPITGSAGGSVIFQAGAIIVQGSVVSERQLVDAIHEGLIRKKRQSGSLQLV